MKRALLFLLCAVMSVQIFSTVDISAELFPTLAGLQRTDIEKHTTCDGKPYLSNFEEYVPIQMNGKLYLSDGRNYLREENNQVLFCCPDFEIYEDIVLYDWTLEIGDTLPHNKSTVHAESDFIVKNVSTVTLLDGKKYKKWTLACGYEYIEGIGAINGEGYGHYLCLESWVQPGTYIRTCLVCASRNGQLLYQMDEAEMERWGAECLCQAEQNPEDLFPTLWGLQRTACSEYTDCEENVTYLMQFDEIKEINGKLYLKCGGVFLREEDNKVLIYSFPYEKDLVLYDWTLEIGDTLQNLGIDPYSFPELEYAAIVDYIAYEDYDEEIGDFIIKKEPLGNKRVKDISTIRLLDGNEYKAWLFGYDWERGGYYIEGIGNANKYGGDYVDLAHPFAVPACYYGERLVCVSRDGVLLYQIDDAEMERLGTDCLCDGYQSSYKDQWCDQWNVLSHGWLGPDEPLYNAHTIIHSLKGDTIINGLVYQKLVGHLTAFESTPDVYIGALRFTEDKKVFVYYDKNEYLLYDFNVQIGDTLNIFGGIDYYIDHQTLPHVIIGIDTLYNGRLKIISNAIIQEEINGNIHEEKRQKKWIEGVGSIDGIVYNDATTMYGSGNNILLCAYHDDECLYVTDNPSYIPLGCVYNNGIFTEIETVELLTQSAQKIMYNGQLLILRDGKTYNVMGMEVTK